MAIPSRPALAAEAPALRIPGLRAASTSLLVLALGHLAVDCCTGIWPVYKTLAGIDLALAGLIATTGSFVGNGLQLVFGALADRGWRKHLLVGGLLLVGGVMLVPYVQSPLLLMLLALATSIGSAAFHPTGAGTASGLSRERTGVVVAVFLAGGYLGYALSQLVFTAAYRATQGRTAPLLLIPVVAALAVGLTLRVPAAAPGAAALQWSVLRAALRPLAPLFGVQAFASAINMAVIFLLPDLLIAKGAPEWVSQGGAHFALVAGGCLSLVPAGHAADRLGARRVLLLVNSVTGVLLLGLLLASPLPAAILVLAAAFGAFNSANNVVVLAEGNRTLPGQASGVSSLLMGLPWCAASVSPVIAGAIARVHGARSALQWALLFVALALATSTAVAPRRRAGSA